MASVYDAPIYDQATNNTANERGLLARPYDYTALGAVDDQLYGTWAPPEGAAGHNYTTYDEAAWFAQIASAIGRARWPAQATTGDLLSLRPSHVAANAGGRVAPALLRVGDLKLPAVPKGAVGTPTQTGKGMEYVIPRGTPAVSDKVASVRIMDPVTSGKCQYPNGYAAYMNRSGQTINPVTGQTIARTDPYAHIPLP